MKALKRGLELLEVGGNLMYTTSSYNPVENEAVVLHVLKECEGTVITVNFLNIWTPEKFAVITLKFKQDGFTIE